MKKNTFDPAVFSESNDPIGAFCDQLLILSGLNELPEDFKQTYLTQLRQEVIRRIGLIALAHLDNETVERLIMELRDPKKNKSILAKIKEKIQNFDDKMASALDEFANTFVTSVQKSLAQSGL